MDELSDEIRELMRPKTLEEIYAAKAERRKKLSALSIDERVLLMEKLQALGRTMIAARAHLEPTPSSPPSSTRPSE